MTTPEDLLKNNNKALGVIGSPSDSFEAVVDILGVSAEDKLLGELVYFPVTEGNNTVISLGQLTDIRTENKWHEEPSFKAVIKRHGSLPHLSGVADNRIATLNVQSSFKISNSGSSPHKLANSPSTGSLVSKMSNELLDGLLKDVVKDYHIESIGKAYDTEVNIPFWFKHFGEGKNGARDAYHIGIFGKTGSGKTVTAARMLKGFAQNKEDMSILILDPQEQFSLDNKVLPDSIPFSEQITSLGVKFKVFNIPEDIYFDFDPELFASFLNSLGLILLLFNVSKGDYEELTENAISRYLRARIKKDNTFRPGSLTAKKLLKEIFNAFLGNDNQKKQEVTNKYVKSIFVQEARRARLQEDIQDKLTDLDSDDLDGFELFEQLLSYFQLKTGAISVSELISDVVENAGNMYVLNLSPRGASKIGSENMQAHMVKQIATKVVQSCEKKYSNLQQANTLIVLDEAHRYLNSKSQDPNVRDVCQHIIDAVRTTRKYGAGYMLITQTIESISDEIIQQMRIFGFGYGLTMGSEFSKLKQIINDDNAARFYRSFIDPSSNNKYPFMFHGPISPLSFTGSPLFLEMMSPK